MAYIPDLPFQHGRPLSPIEEGVGDTILVDYNTTHESPLEHQINATIFGADDLGTEAARYANEQLDQISDNELTINAPQDEP